MTIVAAIDKSDRATEVVNQADTLAEKFDDEIYVVHVMKKSEVIESKELDTGSIESPDLEEMRATARNAGQNTLSDYSADSVLEFIGLIGNPADEIVDYAREVDSRYIVVSPKQQSQTGKILFGSVAQSILLNAHCPVVSFTDL
jgi:nucleotide-binding universal stress UspA family protein